MWYCVVIGCPYGYGRVIKPKTPIRFHVFPHPIRETGRFRQWLALINNPKLYDMQPIAVFKSMRVCRRHFGSESYNGSCRRLTSHALPTLHLADTAERPVALVQPMDAAGGEVQVDQKHQLKRQISSEDSSPSDNEREGGAPGKRVRLEALFHTYAAAQQAHCLSHDDEFANDIIEFQEEYLEEEEYDEASLGSDSILSSSAIGATEFGMTSFSGLIQSELGDLNQVEILNEPPETLLSDSVLSEDRERLTIEKRYEQLVREFATDESNGEEPFYFTDEVQPTTNVAEFRSSSSSMDSDSNPEFCGG